jgi:tryptophan-rich sensory protein
MGVSVSRIVRAGARDSIALKLWVVHYLLNLLWAPLFFGLQYLRVGLVINFALVSTLLVILNLFRAIDPIAAYLQVPIEKLHWQCAKNNCLHFGMRLR